tara:strand:- start:347 stop:784 length:438 start_codon:yes stop_codon:yes gene_type:complete
LLGFICIGGDPFVVAVKADPIVGAGYDVDKCADRVFATDTHGLGVFAHRSHRPQTARFGISPICTTPQRVQNQTILLEGDVILPSVSVCSVVQRQGCCDQTVTVLGPRIKELASVVAGPCPTRIRQSQRGDKHWPDKVFECSRFV